jgi:small ligand-binding sensory domain FIST
MVPAVATALASADKADAEIVAEVVREALTSAGAEIAQSVLLFLTEEFARHAQAAVTAASRAGHCLQVIGCSAPGVFTERDWVLDRPGVAAMVFTADVSIGTANGTDEPVLSLSTPSAATASWLAARRRRFGMLSSSGSTQKAGKIWVHAKTTADNRLDAVFQGASGSVGISRGVRILSDALEATQCEGYDLLRINGYPALNTLMRELPLELRDLPQLPVHQLCAGIVEGDPDEAMARCRYTLVPLIGTNSDERSVTLAAQIPTATRMFWAMRSPLAAERDTRVMLDELDSALAAVPDFGVMFSCMGRGPYFYEGADRDLDLVRARYPRMPLIGAYGSGEIAPQFDGNKIIHNSAVLSLFRCTRNADV